MKKLLMCATLLAFYGTSAEAITIENPTFLDSEVHMRYLDSGNDVVEKVAAHTTQPAKIPEPKSLESFKIIVFFHLKTNPPSLTPAIPCKISSIEDINNKKIILSQPDRHKEQFLCNITG